MTVIHTKQNMVCAAEPEEGDLYVQLVWHGPAEDGRHLRAFEGQPQPIENYEAMLDWAVAMADQMRFPLYVVPLPAKDVFRTEYMKRAVSRLTDHDRGELQRIAITTLAAVMRDCDDTTVRAEAFEILTEMGVVHP